jgi:hypothetical protein
VPRRCKSSWRRAHRRPRSVPAEHGAGSGLG